MTDNIWSIRLARRSLGGVVNRASEVDTVTDRSVTHCKKLCNVKAISQLK